MGGEGRGGGGRKSVSEWEGRGEVGEGGNQ